MAKFSIEAAKRPEGSKPNALRREGKMPATVYGHNGTESLQIVIDAKQAGFLVRDAVERKSQIDLSIPDLKMNTTAVLQEVQKHPWKPSIYHISFMAAKA
ncbi:50S ribosomal protein L25 [filamentous cyanobacterium LEGE 11480]|uniref:50S ribosomal protein L25 n=1 Tax=Romeriopsis navalis LEGE 11480 TaxID=2777977 RepID=A0A928Z420_9CYAN|nr:50S ribosomal protein L25 [Romeriopsis navalis]MBE9032101.1 50S ribosomal protein L25 [Romeriopsis navalis LEGE 11480]